MRKWITQHDVLTKLLSIVAAFILWSYFMGAQNPKRTLEYKDIAVQLTGVDQLYNNYNLKIIEGADATVDVKVSGSTNRLATLTASQIKVQADVSESITAPGTYQLSYTVILPESGMTCESRTPDSITVKADEMETKKVPVSVNLSKSASKNYIFDDPQLSAETVKISGPATVVDQVSTAVIDLDTSGVEKTLTDNYSYKLVDDNGKQVDTTNISRDIASITVTLPVTEIKSVPLEVTVSPEDAAAAISTTISPKSVEIIGDPSAVDAVSSIKLGAINATTAENGDTHTFDIEPPTGVSLNDGQPTSATVTVSVAQDITQKYTITDITLSDDDKDSSATVTLNTQSLDVTLIGPEKLLKKVSTDDIQAVAELSSKELSDGEHTIGVTVSSPDGTTVSGNYSVKITISRDNA